MRCAVAKDKGVLGLEGAFPGSEVGVSDIGSEFVL